MSRLRVASSEFVIPELEEGLLDDPIRVRAAELKASGQVQLDAINTISTEVIGWALGRSNRFTIAFGSAPQQVAYDRPGSGAIAGAMDGAATFARSGAASMVAGAVGGAILGGLVGSTNARRAQDAAAAEQTARMQYVRPHVFRVVADAWKKLKTK